MCILIKSAYFFLTPIAIGLKRIKIEFQLSELNSSTVTYKEKVKFCIWLTVFEINEKSTHDERSKIPTRLGDTSKSQQRLYSLMDLIRFSGALRLLVAIT